MSSKRYLCPGCDKEIQIPSGHAGQRVRCKKCDTIFRIPSHPFRLHDKKNVNCPICEEQFSEESTKVPSNSSDVKKSPPQKQKTKSAKKRDPKERKSAEKKVACPGCERKLSIPSTVIGKRVRCKHCETLFKISGSSTSKSRKQSDPAKSTNQTQKAASKKEAKQDEDQALFLYSCQSCNQLFILPDWLIGKHALCGNCERAGEISGKSETQQFKLKRRIKRGESPTVATEFSNWKLGPTGEFIPVLEENETSIQKEQWERIKNQLDMKQVGKPASTNQNNNQSRKDKNIYSRFQSISFEEDRTSGTKKLIQELLIWFRYNRKVQIASSLTLLLIMGMMTWSFMDTEQEPTYEVTTESQASQEEKKNDKKKTNIRPEEIDLTKEPDDRFLARTQEKIDRNGSSLNNPDSTSKRTSFVPRDRYEKILSKAAFLLKQNQDPAPLFYWISPEDRGTVLSKLYSWTWEQEMRESWPFIEEMTNIFPPDGLQISAPDFWIDGLLNVMKNEKLDQFSKNIAFIQLRNYVRRFLTKWGNLKQISPRTIPSPLLITARSSLRKYVKTLVSLANKQGLFISELARKTLKNQILTLQSQNVKGSYWFTFLLLDTTTSETRRSLNIQKTDIQSVLKKIRSNNSSIIPNYKQFRQILFSKERSTEQAKFLVSRLEHALATFRGNRAKIICHLMGLPGWNDKIHESIFQPAILNLLRISERSDFTFEPFLEASATYSYLLGEKKWFSKVLPVYVKHRKMLPDRIRKFLFLSFRDWRLLGPFPTSITFPASPVFSGASKSSMLNNNAISRYLDQEDQEQSVSESLLSSVRTEIWIHLLNINYGSSPPWKTLFRHALKQNHDKISREIARLLFFKERTENLLKPLLKIYLQESGKKPFLPEVLVSMMLWEIRQDDHSTKHFWNVIETFSDKKEKGSNQQQKTEEIKKKFIQTSFKVIPEQVKSFFIDRFSSLNESYQSEIINVLAQQGHYQFLETLATSEKLNFLSRYSTSFLRLYGLHEKEIRQVLMNRGGESSNNLIEQQNRWIESRLSNLSSLRNWIEWLFRTYGNHPKKFHEFLRSFTFTFEDFQKSNLDFTLSEFLRATRGNIRKSRNLLSLISHLFKRKKIKKLSLEHVPGADKPGNGALKEDMKEITGKSFPDRLKQRIQKWRIKIPEKKAIELQITLMKLNSAWKIYDISFP